VRVLNGKFVVVGLLVLGIGGTVLLNLATKGNPRGDLRVLKHPSSGATRVGMATPVKLIEPCAAVVDFDARFWGPKGHVALRQPATPATITVAPGHERAVLRTASGQMIRLVPQDEPIYLEACPSSPAAS